MSIIYHVTIEAAKKENVFHIKWTNDENVTHGFDQPASGIEPEEVAWGWKDRRNQLRIGNKLCRFLDGPDNYLQQVLKEADNYAESLQVHLSTCSKTANWPFELLAQGSSFLLPRHLHLVRRVSSPGTVKESPPRDRLLRVLFMASSPLDIQSEMDFEKEEDAIFKIMEKLTIDIEVEDSGSLEGLRKKLAQRRYDIVHLSGYTDIDQKGKLFLVMENETGYHRDISADELWQKALKINPPRLLFISGSHTGDASGGTDGSFAHRLTAISNIPAVLSWERLVSDREAIEAAKMIYRELSRGESIIHAVQRARYQLTVSFPSILEPSWPQLRLFSSGGSLNAIVKKEQERQPQMRRMTHIFIRNSQVKVLDKGFVGRRRQLQQSVRVLKQEPQKVGLLILGTGGLGKSCLAGKICERFSDHTLIIVHGKFNTITLGAALKDAFIVSQDDNGKKILSQEIEIAEKLPHFCTTSFKKRNYLLLLDDFEQNLEGFEKGQPGALLPEAANLLQVLLHYLPFSGKMSKVIITSRYEFSLQRQKLDIVNERLEKIWLTGFRQSERRKKAGELKNILACKDKELSKQLLNAGCGNPRLMEWLDLLAGKMKEAEVEQLIKAVAEKQEEFVRVHVIRELLQQGGEQLEHFLRWFSIYRIPVMEEGTALVAKKAGVKNWKKRLRESMALSLTEHDRARESWQVTPFLREELFKGIEEIHACHEAAFAYFKKECESRDTIDPIQTEEWIFHALGCGEENVASEQGFSLLKHLRVELALRESQRIGLWILDNKKQECSTPGDAALLGELASTFDAQANYRKAIEYSQQALSLWKKAYGENHQEVATTLNNLAESWRALNEPEKSIKHLEQALSIDHAVHGKVNPNVALRLNNLGTAYHSLGDYRKAAEHFGQALEIDYKVYGEVHPDVARDLNNLGETLRELGDFKMAVKCYKQAILIDREVYGEKHPKLARDLNNLGLAWNTLGDHQKATGYYKHALSIDRAVYGNTHPNVAKYLNNLGLAWKASGKYKIAADCLEQALTINLTAFGENHPLVAAGLNNLGTTFFALNDLPKAREFFQQALLIDRAIYGETHPEVARDLNNLGAVYYALNNHRKAVESYEKALAISVINPGEKQPKTAKTLTNLGTAYFELGEKKKAKDYYEQAYAIFNQFFGPEHPNTKMVAECLDIIQD